MKRIVVGVDGSAGADEAVESALELAQAVGAAVTFVCARVVPGALLGKPYYQRELDAETAHARKVVGEALDQAAAAGIEADSEILDSAPAEALIAVAETHDADLIVVGSRGLGAGQTAIFGSVSKALVARSRRPVLVVKTASGQEAKRNHPLVHDGAVLSR
jgi:nucleotide-binding universal stress UspA family protein